MRLGVSPEHLALPFSVSRQQTPPTRAKMRLVFAGPAICSFERESSMVTTTISTASRVGQPMTKEERKVIFASSLGTVFEWYDFYLYGTLAAIIGKQFFSNLDPGSQVIFSLLAFAAGFIVRPFGAIFLGRLGDMIGRKYTFLVTILIMG